RRRPPGETYGEKIDVLEKPAVCQCDIAADCRRGKWSCYPDIRIGPRSECIVSRNQHALSSQLQIKSRFGQLNERKPPAHSKRAAGQIATEPIESQGVVPKSHPCIKTPQRGKSRVCETSDVHRHVPRSTEDRMPERTAHINVQSKIAIQLLEIRNELTNKIHRAARQPSLRCDRCVVRKSSSLDNFRHIEGYASVYFHRLNPRLRELSRIRQAILCGLRAELERRRFHFLPQFVSQIPHLQVEAHFQISDCPVTVEARIHDA